MRIYAEPSRELDVVRDVDVIVVEGLLVAGRCISSQQQPYESHRAMVNVMAIGQAAGTAAALDGVTPRKLRVDRLQRALVAQGAELRR